MKRPRLLELVLVSLAIATIPAMLPAQGPRPANDQDRRLIEAVRNRDLGKAQALLSNGADIEAKGVNGETLLILAAQDNDLAMVKLLLDKGADVNAKDQQGETALTNAASSATWSGNMEVARVLFEKTPDEREREQALFAALRGQGSVVIQSISDNANEVAATQTTEPAPEPPDSPVVKAVEFFLDNGVPIEARDEDRSTPLITAAAYGETDVVRLLLKRGADIQAKDKYGNAPLMGASCQCAMATMNGTYDIVKIMLEKGADPNGRNQEGTTPLMLASGMQGDPAVLKLLLDAGADPSVKDKHGDTALALAIKSYRDDKVEVLRKAAKHAR